MEADCCYDAHKRLTNYLQVSADGLSTHVEWEWGRGRGWEQGGGKQSNMQDSLPANHFHPEPAVATLSSLPFHWSFLSDGVCLWITCTYVSNPHTGMHAHVHNIIMCLNVHIYKVCVRACVPALCYSQ